jgi:hypothetical protein
VDESTRAARAVAPGPGAPVVVVACASRCDILGPWRIVRERSDPGATAGVRKRVRTHPTQPTRRNESVEMNVPLSVHSIVVATSEQVSCHLGEESAILNLKNTVYYGLDPVGARIWNLLQQPQTVGDLRDALLAEYEVDTDRCERDLLGLLEKMLDEGLIQVRSAAAG